MGLLRKVKSMLRKAKSKEEIDITEWRASYKPERFLMPLKEALILCPQCGQLHSISNECFGRGIK